MRATIAALLLVVGLVAGWFGHKALMSPPDLATISIYQDWRLACPQIKTKDASCEIQQDVLDAKSGTELARMSVFNFKDTGNTMIVTVPFNVLLDPGIGIGIGNDKPRVYPFETCNGVGCVVRIKFDDDLAKALDTAATNNVQARILFAGLDGKPVGLPFSLKGYSDVIAAFTNAEAKRRSWWRRLWS
jgi:invasion protein IalB